MPAKDYVVNLKPVFPIFTPQFNVTEMCANPRFTDQEASKIFFLSKRMISFFDRSLFSNRMIGLETAVHFN